MNRLKLNIIMLGVSLLILSTPTFAEEIIYQCSLSKGKQVKIALVNGIPQYQYGKPNQPEITLPTKPEDKSKVHYADFDFKIGMAEGNARYYRFTNGDYNYVVYSGSGHGGAGHGWSRDNLTIFQGNKKIKTIECASLYDTNSNYDPASNLESDDETLSEFFSD